MAKHGAVAVLAALAASGVAAHDTLEHSSLLTLGVQSHATTEGESHFWRFDLDGSATVEIRSGGSEVDVQGWLLDSEGIEVARDDNSATGDNFRMIEELPEGPHYVEVAPVSTDAGGQYGLVVRLVREDDHGDHALSSTRLVEGIRTAGSITPADDVDVFRLDIPNDADVTIVSSGPTDTRGTLEDADLNRVRRAGEGGSGGNFQIEERLTAGVYYLSVDASERGAYGVRYTVPAPEPRTPVLPPAPSVDVRNLLGASMGTHRWTDGTYSSPDLYVFADLYYEGTAAFAVEADFDARGFEFDEDENYWIGSTTTQLADYDYLVIYRGFTVCWSYVYRLASPTEDDGNTILLFGDLDTLTDGSLECDWTDASLYDARVYKAFPHRPGASSDAGREVAMDRERRMVEAHEDLAPIAATPAMVSAVEAAMP